MTAMGSSVLIIRAAACLSMTGESRRVLTFSSAGSATGLCLGMYTTGLFTCTS